MGSAKITTMQTLACNGDGGEDMKTRTITGNIGPTLSSHQSIGIDTFADDVTNTRPVDVNGVALQ